MGEDVEDLAGRLLRLITGNGGGERGLALLEGALGGRLDSTPTTGAAAGEIAAPLQGLLGGASVGQTVASVFPLLSVFRALGGASAPEEPAFETFTMPDRITATLGYDAAQGSVQAIDYGERQTIRNSETRLPGPQVQIQVNALDGRSILDRSEEIADAVRSALLQSHSLNEVFWED